MKDKNHLIRLDEYLLRQKLVNSRHRAADLIRSKQVRVNQNLIDRPAFMINPKLKPRLKLAVWPPYVSRGGDKLAAAAEILKLSFKNKIIFDVGAHCGGFTDFMQRQGAKFIVAIDVGSQKLDSSLKQSNILNFVKTDIRQFIWPNNLPLPDLIVADLSFISLRHILGSLTKFCHPQSQVLILFKPQFEADAQALKKGIVRRDLRQTILTDFEIWLKESKWRILAKTDALKGSKGNLERFYLLRKIKD